MRPNGTDFSFLSTALPTLPIALPIYLPTCITYRALQGLP